MTRFRPADLVGKLRLNRVEVGKGNNATHAVVVIVLDDFAG